MHKPSLREPSGLDKPPPRPGSFKIKPLTMSFSQPQLSGISSLLASTVPSMTGTGQKRAAEETRTVKITPLAGLHTRVLSKGSIRSMQSKSRGDYETRDEFALAEYRKQEIKRARTMVNSQYPYWCIDSWFEDEAADKKLSRLCTPRDPSASSRARQLQWEREMTERLSKASNRLF